MFFASFHIKQLIKCFQLPYSRVCSGSVCLTFKALKQSRWPACVPYFRINDAKRNTNPNTHILFCLREEVGFFFLFQTRSCRRSDLGSEGRTRVKHNEVLLSEFPSFYFSSADRLLAMTWKRN